MSDVQLLPTELLQLILLRLPVKSLLRSRCVSKPLRDLIDSQYFVKFHLTQSIQENTNINLFFDGCYTLHHLDFDSPAQTVKKIDHPMHSEPDVTVVFGACNGLVCLTTAKSDNVNAFWNPSTRRFRRIPLSPFLSKRSSSTRFSMKGFGYDKVNDDYKLVKLIQSVGIDSFLGYPVIEVYSMKSNMWRNVGDFPHYIWQPMNCNVFANGALHWLVSQKPNRSIEFLIGAFDLATEKCCLVPQPEFPDNDFCVRLDVLGGCLCMVCGYPDKRFDIWVMKSYGVKSSWMKLFSTTDMKDMEVRYLRLILYSKSGREVLIEIDGKMLLWYDLEKKIIRRFTVDGMPESFESYAFVGSLVQVDGGGASSSGVKKKKNGKKRDDFLSKGFKLVL